MAGSLTRHAAIIGAGPGGLIAAEMLAQAGISVTVYERKPSPARKFLLAGRGGLNITHSEPLDIFMARYGDAASFLAPAINAFTPQNLRDWCDALGEETFIGTSGRVFPKSFKATPLLRNWQKRLEQQGINFAYGHEWQGWNDEGELVFANGAAIRPDATLLALGGASWPRLGADGRWIALLAERGVKTIALRPANCGFEVAWSQPFVQRYAGQPLKNITITLNDTTIAGEAMIAANGIEGGAVYALSRDIRTQLENTGAPVTVAVDLRPGTDEKTMIQKLSAPRGRLSLSNHLRKAGGLSPAATGLVQEYLHRHKCDDRPATLARLIKALPLTLHASFPIDRAISSAGGVALDAVDGNLQLKQLPGVYVAGEMLDWEAPTGGYLLQATFSTAVLAARAIAAKPA